ncbi:type III pantothenate kinase [Litoribrevibacter albus]|uniref:Type III pantothenate kinase n=1 Tax=Litoribrevibacter albus TaxID=1473156 RepID=A0AA37W4U1_9GAMM|nr:type III pantothenate kinase [Litoribrevibacter albus]GLQ30462.1 hypothetical protein GCM10007876_09400 [Litoribrevibacter albus]
MAEAYFDLGNTSLKVFDTDGNLLGVYSSLEQDWLVQLRGLLDRSVIRRVVISSVAVPEKLNAVLEVLRGIDYQLAAYDVGNWMVQHSYDDPSKLGVDRLLAIEAAYRHYETSLVVIDCGSAVTLDVVDKHGKHQGGYIVPGFRLQMESLLQGTNLSFDELLPDTRLGKNTTECIRHGSLRMIKSLCESLILEVEPAKVVLTGGDLNGVLSSLSELGEVDQYLVFNGLKAVYG